MNTRSQNSIPTGTWYNTVETMLEFRKNHRVVGSTDMESLFETRGSFSDFHDQPSRERARDRDSNPRPCTRAAAFSARPLAILG